MAKQDKLIDYAYMKEEVDLPQNIENQDLENKIYRAQRMLRMLMGVAFYNDYVENYKSNTFSAAYTALYEYVQVFVAWQAFEFYTVKANYNPTRSGFRIHSEENSVAAPSSDMAIIIKDAKQEAQQAKTELVNYLNANSSLFPLYTTDCSGNLTGNTFHISAVKKSHKHNCGCSRCRC